MVCAALDFGIDAGEVVENMGKLTASQRYTNLL